MKERAIIRETIDECFRAIAFALKDNELNANGTANSGKTLPKKKRPKKPKETNKKQN